MRRIDRELVGGRIGFDQRDQAGGSLLFVLGEVGLLVIVYNGWSGRVGIRVMHAVACSRPAGLVIATVPGGWIGAIGVAGALAAEGIVRSFAEAFGLIGADGAENRRRRSAGSRRKENEEENFHGRSREGLGRST